MSRLAGVHDLGYCFTRLGATGNSVYSQDWLSTAANLGGMVGKALWYGRNQIAVLEDALAKTGKKILPTPTAIVDVAMVVVSAIDLLNGLGDPDPGTAFATAKDKYDLVLERLEAAIPDPRDWDGGAAKSYVDQTEDLRGLVDSMQDKDQDVANLMASQAKHVTEARQCIALTVMGLVLCQGIALGLYLIPGKGPELSCGFQILAAGAAAHTVRIYEQAALFNSTEIVRELDSLGRDYVNLAETAVPAPTFARIKVAEAEETRVSSFQAISDSMSEISALSQPTIASLAGKVRESGSAEQRAVLEALIGDNGQASGQPAKRIGHLSQHMNLVKQIRGAVSTGQRGQRAAAPAAKAAGAASGTQGAEGAPVDVAAVGHGGSREPSPAERAR